VNVTLYTNIPHEEGIEAYGEVWNNRANKCLSTDSLIQLLKHANFMFNGEHYLQFSGTAVQTKMALSYAKIFMGRLERRLPDYSLTNPLC
jgi:hypothetical protein